VRGRVTGRCNKVMGRLAGRCNKVRGRVVVGGALRRGVQLWWEVH